MSYNTEKHDEPKTTASKIADAALKAAKEAGGENVIVLVYAPDSDYRDSSVGMNLRADNDEQGYALAAEMMVNALGSLLETRGKRLVVVPMKNPIGSDQ